MGLWWVARNRPQSSAPEESDGYSSTDRLIHVLAIASPRVQHGLARLEALIWRKTLARVAEAPPIFITSLPRAGTTALLNALRDHPSLATHLYRDMPFVSAPLLWSRLAGKGRSVARRQRAHGDGMEIDLDSPEAFEEVFWLNHWPAKFAGATLPLWTQNTETAKAAPFFQRHFRALAFLRRPARAFQDGTPVRYISKNNGNIARLAFLPRLFPGCATIVPIRQPAAHAQSLLPTALPVSKDASGRSVRETLYARYRSF